MSRTAQRVLAGIFLVSLLFVTPTPSQAAGFRLPVQSIGWTARIWNWLESLVLGGAAKASPTLSEQEGSAIDPNGKD